MASSPVTGHLTIDGALLDNRQDITGTAIAMVLLTDIKNSDAFDFDETDVISLCKK